ncbi:MAG: hypothetical protein V1891_02010 [bacterium]
MRKIPQKQLYLFVLFLAIILAFSGCRKKSGNEIEKLGNSNINEKSENASSTDENAIDTATGTDAKRNWKLKLNYLKGDAEIFN